MSRSRRHTPISAITLADTEKQDKRKANRAYRKAVTQWARRYGQRHPPAQDEPCELADGWDSDCCWKCGLYAETRWYIQRPHYPWYQTPPIPLLREVSDPWNMAKDGKTYWCQDDVAPALYARMMRK